ncbi:MAG: CcdB family protein [Burkholderiaceae bacterium]|nr:CcdB family protein [Burkholderiaceae bacterium]MEB2317188.1 CcdB family protein [Pseudomonadota bacterium]
MARFHVYANAESGSYLLDVQANLLNQLNTRVVVPLLPLDTAPQPVKVLNPVFEIDGVSCLMATQFLAAVPRRLIGNEVLSLEEKAHIIVDALDCLFQGV